MHAAVYHTFPALPVVLAADAGLVIVPLAGAPAQQGAPDANSPSPSSFSVAVPANSIEDGRAAATAEAERVGAAQGLIGTPRFLAEGLSAGTYRAVVILVAGPTQATEPLASAPPSLPEAAAPPSAAPETPKKPAWILVVPVEQVSGRPVWGRASAWSRAWIAPVRQSGMRLVTIMGDADDHQRLTDDMLADPDDPGTAEAALGLAHKYGAPAVSLIQYDGATTLQGWLWRPGSAPQTSTVDASPEAAKTSGASLVADLAEPAADGLGNVVNSPSADQTAPAVGLDVDLEDHPEYVQDTRYGFAIVMSTDDNDAAVQVRHSVAQIPGVAILSSDTDQDGLVIQAAYNGSKGQLMTAIAAAGITIDTY
jgi:hypothetical protein